MYNPLIKLVHKSGDTSYVRASLIERIENHSDSKKVYLNGITTTYCLISNIEEIVSKIHEIENRNEQTILYSNHF